MAMEDDPVLVDVEHRLADHLAANRRLLYEASLIKRKRSTKEQVRSLWQGLYDIVSAMRPMTVRQVFYQATVRGAVEKTEAGYSKVQRALAQMRKEGAMPY